MRLSLGAYARHSGAWRPERWTIAQRIQFASELITDGERLELQSEPGRALSETEAADAIRAGKTVEVVS